jgi:hypothetical protein|tara:strand:+ start:2463 stop:2834 length:372 start_codon:yes stop_codon:yes gene_type:complete
MAAKLQTALEFSNYRQTLNNQKDVLKAKTESLLSYSINGGTFTIDRELITFVKVLLDDKHNDAILLDVYNHPIAIDLSNFYAEIMSRYFEVTNDYYIEYEKIRKARNVSSVLDLNNPGSDSGE